MGKGYNKQYIILKDKPIVAHTIKTFEESNLIDEIILVVGKGEVKKAKEDIIEKYNFKKVTNVIEGGKERYDSVFNGLKATNKECNIVLIHDGARPFVTEDIIKDGIESVTETKATITAVPVKDTIKTINTNNEVESTPARNTLWSVQTPQFFEYALLINAYENFQHSSMEITDDAMLVENLGHIVKVINGSYENIKITTPEDLILGEGILKNREKGE